MGSDKEAERRKSPSQETIENTVAIAKLITVSERTTKDVDRIVQHIEKFLPVHEQISHLKKILYTSIAVVSMYLAWLTLEHFSLKDSVGTSTATQIEAKKNILEKINNNEKLLNRNYGYMTGKIK